MYKLRLTLALLAAFMLSACISTGSSDSSATSNALSDSSAPQMSDSELTSAVSNALQQDSQLAGVSVSAEQGVVTLSGSVPSAQAYNRAISLARSASGRPPVASNLKF